MKVLYHPVATNGVDHIMLYFSLGDREARTRNRYLRSVQENTEQIVSHFKQLGLDVSWELNPGNHFKDAALRSAKGIRALLE